MEYFAHSYLDSSGIRHDQTIAQHCRSGAEYAASAAPPGMAKTAYLSGLLHDMGKYSDAFQVYIDPEAESHARRGSVNHTFAGVRFVLERWHSEIDDSYRRMTSEMLAFVIGSHHGQFDCISPDGTDGFLHRITKEGTGYAQAKERYLSSCAAPLELDRLFAESVQEITDAIMKLRKNATRAEQLLFYTSLLSRQLLAAVIEGDRRDTAEFMRAVLPQINHVAPAGWENLLQGTEEMLCAFPADSPIDMARRQISAQCRKAAEQHSGIYRLTVPTGGGKTLAALRFSLAHADAQKMAQIIFVTPLLSVLEQNAAVLHKFIGNDSLILEHHSNVVREQNDSGELDANELLLESWCSPVIITTLVQLLNTLFCGKTSCIRRMAALRKSVIVIDEVQSVPRNLLSEFNLAVNYLSSFCGCTVVLCSATQPCLDRAENPLCFSPTLPDLVPFDAALWEIFRRTSITDCRRNGGYPIEELADFASDCAEREGSLLVVCNTKAEANDLFRALKQRWSLSLYHLSTAMCMQHRIDTLREINEVLDRHVPVICVATQLVEAGVDFSFGCVIRVSAGIDNIIQAAGRCNRSGEHQRLCPVYIVNIRGENLSRLKEIDQSQKAAESLLLRFSRNPAAYGNDLTSEAAIRGYYSDLYDGMKKGAQDYPLLKYNTTLLDLLSANRNGRGNCPTGDKYTIAQAFCTAGEEFHVFDDATTDVLAPYGDGNMLLAEFASEKVKHDIPCRMKLIKEAARYSVSLYDYQLAKLRERGGIYSLCEDSVLVLQPGFYSGETGFSPDGDNLAFWEVHHGV